MDAMNWLSVVMCVLEVMTSFGHQLVPIISVFMDSSRVGTDWRPMSGAVLKTQPIDISHVRWKGCPSRGLPLSTRYLNECVDRDAKECLECTHTLRTMTSNILRLIDDDSEEAVNPMITSTTSAGAVGAVDDYDEHPETNSGRLGNDSPSSLSLPSSEGSPDRWPTRESIQPIVDDSNDSYKLLFPSPSPPKPPMNS
ncbi:unnamed protein product [Oppiella nova]|uniref:Uncharacterized protein n=1 Tax=Oppiella nova TaxID=334625 RepID=A0A7R9LWI5_9ACAR|nr:unnamed protein product [Oppiella nova]CAG2167360.1 unnamed protein product [Oppiella nova]